MGFIRFILAVSVLAVHSKPILGLDFIGGSIAVQSFFIISGFYMSLILNEKYIGKQSYLAFLKNRMLKLFPSYWIVIALTLTLATSYLLLTGKPSLGLQSWFADYGMNLYSKLFFVVINIFIIGQDIVFFLSLNKNNGWLYFSGNTDLIDPHLYSFLLNGPGWTLSIELLFYAIAPFIVRKNIYIIFFLMAASLLLRVLLYSIGLHNIQFEYKFFPTELAFFLAGSISYKFYTKLKSHKVAKAKLTFYVLYLFILCEIIFYYFVPDYFFKKWFYFCSLLVAIPFIFIHTGNKKVDQYFGELSYPLYISHLLLLGLLSSIYSKLPEYYSNFSGIILLTFTILFSIVMIKYVIKPVEVYRKKVAKDFLLNKQ